MKQKDIRQIIKEHLVLPILKLKETHPDHFFTESGYSRLLDNTIEDLRSLIQAEKKVPDYHGHGGDEWLWEGLRKEGWNMALDRVLEMLT